MKVSPFFTVLFFLTFFLLFFCGWPEQFPCAHALSGESAASPSADSMAASDEGASPNNAILSVGSFTSSYLSSASTVRFFNRNIVTLKATVDGQSPESRAQEYNDNLQNVFSQETPGKVTTERKPSSTIIKVDENPVATVYDEDLELLVDDNKNKKLNRIIHNLDLAIDDYQEQRGYRFLKPALISLVVAVVLFVLTRYAVAFLKKFFNKYIITLLTGVFTSFANRDFREQHLPTIVKYVRKAIYLLLNIAYIVVGYICVTLVLNNIPYTRPWASDLSAYIWNIFQAFYSWVAGIIPNIVFIIIILIIAKYTVNLANVFFKGIERKQLKIFFFDEDTLVPTKRVTAAVIWIIAVGLAYPYIPGSNSPAFQGLSVIIGLMLSLGSKNVVNEMVGGLIFIYTKSMRVGDWIRVREFEGEVLSMGVFNVQIRTIAQEEITLPNSLILESVTVNYTKQKAQQGVALYAIVTVDYGTPWRKIEAMLLESAARTSGVLHNGKETVWKSGLHPSAVEYTLVTWIDDPDRRRMILTELNGNILDVFNEYGVELVTTEFRTNLPSSDEGYLVPAERWYEPPASKKTDWAGKLKKTEDEE